MISRGSGLSFVSVCVSVFAGFELAREKLPGGTDSLLLGMGVAVKGCLDIRMSHDALKGLDVKERCGHRGKGVAENVCRRAVQIDGAVDALPCALVGLFRDGTVAADDVFTLRDKLRQVCLQLRQKRNEAVSRLALGRPDDRLVPGIGHAALHMNLLQPEIHIRPTKSQHLAAPDACVDGQQNEKLV